MEPLKSWSIVVLDDRREFALHVWRYLNRSLSLGTGPGEQADQPEKSWMPEGQPLLSQDGTTRFWWLCADGQWKEKLERVRQEIDEERKLLVLVDIMGKRRSLYDAKSVVEMLESWKRDHPEAVEHQVVSAYQIGRRVDWDVEVLPKSRSTLNAVRQKVYQRGSSGRPEIERHVLITGAGFEIRNDKGGFGMPFTRELLESMGPPFQLQRENATNSLPDEDTIVLKSSSGYPYPVGGTWKKAHSLVIQKCAESGQLDLYWDYLLSAELFSELEMLDRLESSAREEVKTNALLRERRKREAFRRAIQEHDWGFMNQSVAAAGLGWHAWLTTNYTRFADRAISLISPLSWRIISTAAEANTSVREDNWVLEKGKKDVTNQQYLFKLHGDIGHLHTMAIAGHDKDTFSPLSVPIDDLYQVYASAERFLSYSLSSNDPVVWHIVGHGLQDERLMKLIQRACRQINTKHLFLITDIVDPTRETPEKNLQKSLKTAQLTNWVIQYRQLFADEYMARLACNPLPRIESVEDGIGWFEKLPPGRLELGGP